MLRTFSVLSLLSVAVLPAAIAQEYIISTIAGPGKAGLRTFSGDGGRAKQADLNGPGSVAVDNSGNVFIADSGNHRIRRVSPDGVITTVAATAGAPSGLTADSGARARESCAAGTR